MKHFWKYSGAVSRRLLAARSLLVTLDFDGTLAELAGSPEHASLRPEFKAALSKLTGLYGVHVFILSGRALRAVRRLVGLKNVHYGGNHGIEVLGPGLAWSDEKALRMRGRINAAAEGLRRRFPPETGVLVEDKRYSLSVHYRNLLAAHKRAFFGRMKKLMAERQPGLRWRGGHKVFELLPEDAAHKGHALARLARELGGPLCVAVGDDVTDEDMFEAAAGRGIAIRVGRKSGSKAGYYLRGQPEVLRLLRFIADSRSWDKKWRRELWSHSNSARG